jgi:hypothetical protein
MGGWVNPFMKVYDMKYICEKFLLLLCLIIIIKLKSISYFVMNMKVFDINDLLQRESIDLLNLARNIVKQDSEMTQQPIHFILTHLTICCHSEQK